MYISLGFLLCVYLTGLAICGTFWILAASYMAWVDARDEEKILRAIYKVKADARRAAAKAKANARDEVRRERNRQRDLTDGWLATTP
jgi:hypothetical protein